MCSFLFRNFKNRSLSTCFVGNKELYVNFRQPTLTFKSLATIIPVNYDWFHKLSSSLAYLCMYIDILVYQVLSYSGDGVVCPTKILRGRLLTERQPSMFANSFKLDIVVCLSGRPLRKRGHWTGLRGWFQNLPRSDRFTFSRNGSATGNCNIKKDWLEFSKVTCIKKENKILLKDF